MLVTFVFRRPYCDYDKLRGVWERSAAKHMPAVPRRVVELEPPEDTGRLDDITYAFIKAVDYVLEQGRDCVVCDIDMMFCGDMMDAFDKPFDIAVTVRDIEERYNTGVWFYRETPKAREFMLRWKAEAQYLFENQEQEHDAIYEYAGLDQAALARARKNTTALVEELPCALYNAEQSCWKHLRGDVRAVHIKSELRDACLGAGSAGKGYSKKRMRRKYLHRIAKMWRGYL